MKKQKYKGRRQKVFGAFRGAAIVMALSLILGQASAGGTVYALQSAMADADTRQDYKVTLGAEDSTRNAGRIWVDKSVSAEDIVFSGDLASDRIQIEKGDADFLVTYSALPPHRALFPNSRWTWCLYWTFRQVCAGERIRKWFRLQTEATPASGLWSTR